MLNGVWFWNYITTFNLEKGTKKHLQIILETGTATNCFVSFTLKNNFHLNIEHFAALPFLDA